ncbi:MAG TPA: hypothetical protein EYN33_02425 [Gammaproteobacteria bacterium]|nr:hypothetical protein [Gammaproteobacteria bacterium]
MLGYSVSIKGENMGQELSEIEKQMLKREHKESPFRKDLVIPEGHKLVKLMQGKESQLSLIAGSTGEEMELLSFARKKVDKETFVKYYTDEINKVHSLGLAGRRVMDIVQWIMQKSAIDRDEIHLGLPEMNLWNEREGVESKMSKSSMYRGIEELILKRCLARNGNGQTGYYWINPKVLFNGKRQTLINIIELDESFIEGEVEIDDPRLTADKQKELKL